MHFYLLLQWLLAKKRFISAISTTKSRRLLLIEWWLHYSKHVVSRGSLSHIALIKKGIMGWRKLVLQLVHDWACHLRTTRPLFSGAIDYLIPTQPGSVHSKSFDSGLCRKCVDSLLWFEYLNWEVSSLTEYDGFYDLSSKILLLVINFCNKIFNYFAKALKLLNKLVKVISNKLQTFYLHPIGK